MSSPSVAPTATEPEEPIGVRAMRLPFYPPFKSPVLVDLHSKGGGEGAQSELLDDPPIYLELPTQVSDMYVGEIFKAYIHVGNDSLINPVFNVSVTVEMEISGNRSVLCNTTGSPTPQIDPGSFYSSLITHQLGDVGTYVMVVSVTYFTSKFGDPRNLRRTYRFPVSQPFSIGHRVAQIGNKFLVECSLETSSTALKDHLFVTGVDVIPPNGFKSTTLTDSKDVPSTRLFAGLAAGAPGIKASHQWVFAVEPLGSAVDSEYLNELSSAGTLCYEWRCGKTGSAGRYAGHDLRITPQKPRSILLRLVPPNSAGKLDENVSAVVVPLEKPFTLYTEVVNRGDTPADITLVCDPGKMGPVQVIGITTKKVGVINPCESVQVPIELFPTAPGVHWVEGIDLFDTRLNSRIACDKLCNVIVY